MNCGNHRLRQGECYDWTGDGRVLTVYEERRLSRAHRQKYARLGDRSILLSGGAGVHVRAGGGELACA